MNVVLECASRHLSNVTQEVGLRQVDNIIYAYGMKKREDQSHVGFELILKAYFELVFLKESVIDSVEKHHEAMHAQSNLPIALDSMSYTLQRED